MKAGVLKKILERIPDETELVISCDSEGNSFSPLDSYSLGKYLETSHGRGEFACDAQDEKALDGMGKTIDAFALWPTV